MKYNFCIIGNGAVGLMTAYELCRSFPDKRILLIGPKEQTASASMAAGAMHAVFAEIEAHFYQSGGDQQQFDLAQKSKKCWEDFFNVFGSDGRTANDTLLYLKNTDNPFEVANFEVATKVAEEFGILRTASKIEVSENTALEEYESAVVLQNEFAFCPETITMQITKFLDNNSNVTYIDDLASHIDKNQVFTQKNGYIFSDQVIVCNGAASNELVGKYGCVPVYQGVGTAIVVDSSTINFGNKFVVRTVNRGGAQCGVHVVPRANGTHYIGAGNYLSEFDNRTEHRLETVRYLTNVAEQDILGIQNTYNMRGSLILGKRPRSFDGWPLFGRLKQNESVIVASGWNRVGLTLSPLIAREIVGLITDSNSKNITSWEPDRSPVSFGTEEECANFFAKSRCANLIEHKILAPNSKDYDNKFSELYILSQKYNKSITTKLGLNESFGIHPDLYGVLGQDD